MTGPDRRDALQVRHTNTRDEPFTSGKLRGRRPRRRDRSRRSKTRLGRSPRPGRSRLAAIRDSAGSLFGAAVWPGPTRHAPHRADRRSGAGDRGGGKHGVLRGGSRVLNPVAATAVSAVRHLASARDRGDGLRCAVLGVRIRDRPGVDPGPHSRLGPGVHGVLIGPGGGAQRPPRSPGRGQRATVTTVRFAGFRLARPGTRAGPHLHGTFTASRPCSPPGAGNVRDIRGGDGVTLPSRPQNRHLQEEP